jgi:hypothetical protein
MMTTTKATSQTSYSLLASKRDRNKTKEVAKPDANPNTTEPMAKKRTFQ